jgi:hypothetical protein
MGSTGVAAKILYELREPNEARRFLLQGLWWQRVTHPAAAGVWPALELALEVSAGGQPLPPVGFVADVANAATGVAADARHSRPLPGVPANLLRTYEDHVLGKLYADWTFGRAADALRRYEGRDRVRGLAFLLDRFRERAGFAGVELSPSVVKAALELRPEQALTEGWETLARDGPHPLLLALYESLPAAARRVAEVLAPEDVFELEHRTALAELGERLALRQVLQAAALLDATLPRHGVRPAAGRAEVPTRVLDEDTYPVGGFSSLSTRGTVESLLHSQLAYMEPGGDGPDLFDIKFVRDELLYYSRDENQFLRRRRAYVFALSADLATTRFKDPELPFQRGVLLLGLIVVAVRRLSEWLSTDALAFEVAFPDAGKDEPLAAERALLETLLREPLANGTARLVRLAAKDLPAHCTALARKSLCHCLVIGTNPPPLRADDVAVARLRIDGPRPALGDGGEEPAVPEADDAAESWGRALERVLGRWV